MREPDLLETRITRLFEEGLNVSVPSRETDLFESGGLDSLVFVELLVLMEREFGVSVALEEMELDNFRSIERIAEYLRNERRDVGEVGRGEVPDDRDTSRAMDATR